MRRRQFITLLGGAAASWPLMAHGQQAAMPVIGLIRTGSHGQGPDLEHAFLQGLNQVGYVENQNVAIERRWAEGHYERQPGILAELVSRRVAVIAVPGSTPAAIAAKAATQTIPIVFMMGADPVDFGLVASLARPGGNITGVAMVQTDIATKRLDLVHQLIPTALTIGLLRNPMSPQGEPERREIEAAAQALGLKLHVANAKDQDEIDASFPNLIAQGARAIMIASDALFYNSSKQIAILAARHAIPAISVWREYTAAGGLMSYGTNLGDAYRLAGIFVGRILKGENPADMPVQQATKFEFVINVRTARALGLIIPASILALADEVID